MYKLHADNLYKQTGEGGADAYWEAQEAKLKNAKKQRILFEKIDEILGGEKEVSAVVLESAKP